MTEKVVKVRAWLKELDDAISRDLSELTDFKVILAEMAPQAPELKADVIALAERRQLGSVWIGWIESLFISPALQSKVESKPKAVAPSTDAALAAKVKRRSIHADPPKVVRADP
jgi:hypothetical protein